VWNFAGLNSGADWGEDDSNGMPYITSHYGFTMVDFYLYGALTGQQQNLGQGVLSFDPVYPCPYTLPLLLQDTYGLRDSVCLWSERRGTGSSSDGGSGESLRGQSLKSLCISLT
jgi:hypothetical protein